MKPWPYENETALVNACIEVLRAFGCHCWRQNTGAVRRGNRYIKFGFPGISDIIGWTPNGQFLAVECKRPGAVPSNEQRVFLELVKQSGGVAILAYDVEDIEQWRRTA